MEQALVNSDGKRALPYPAGKRITIPGRSIDKVLLARINTGTRYSPTHKLQLVFQRFHRLMAGRCGSRLGITLVRALIELQAAGCGPKAGKVTQKYSTSATGSRSRNANRSSPRLIRSIADPGPVGSESSFPTIHHCSLL